MKRTPFERLAILPGVVANTVAWRHAPEFNLTPEQIDRFCDECERRCRNAYTARAEWFERIVRSKTNHGLNRLYMFTAHWFAGFVKSLPQSKRI